MKANIKSEFEVDALKNLFKKAEQFAEEAAKEDADFNDAPDEFRGERKRTSGFVETKCTLSIFYFSH